MKMQNKPMRSFIACLVVGATLLLCGCTGKLPEAQTEEAPTQTQQDPIESTPDKATQKNTEKYSEKLSEQEKEEQGGEDTPEQPSPIFYAAEYVIGSITGAGGSFFSANNRFATADFISIADVEAISIKSGYNLTWFAYDEDKVYLGNGSNTYPTLPAAGVWLSDGEDVTVEKILGWNADTQYLKFAVKKNDNSAIVLQRDIELSEIKIYQSGYDGDSSDASGVTYEKIAVLSSGQQDGAVFGDYFFSFNSSGKCTVYSVDGYAKIAEFTIDKNGVLSPHSNSVCFGTYYYDAEDEFPLLYCNIYNTYSSDRSRDGMCNVYRITRSGNSFDSQLVQVIKVGFTADTTLWSSEGGDARPYGNFVVDTDNDKLYAFTMRSGAQQTRFFKFDLPTLSEGVYDSTLGVKLVTLTANDIESSFDVEFFNYIQGATYRDGKIYSLEGFTNNTTSPARLRIVDLEEKKVVRVVDLYSIGLAIEPEAINFIGGELCYVDYNKAVYKLKFN